MKHSGEVLSRYYLQSWLRTVCLLLFHKCHGHLEALVVEKQKTK
jgi:hypothetical protein